MNFPHLNREALSASASARHIMSPQPSALLARSLIAICVMLLSAAASLGDSLQTAADSLAPLITVPEPLPDSRPQPVFPEKAAIAGQSGKVEIEVYVDEQGDVKKSKILLEDPTDLGFAEEVQIMVRRWKFTPAMREGQPLAVWTTLAFDFVYGIGGTADFDRDIIQVAYIPEREVLERLAREAVPSPDSLVMFEVPPQPLPWPACPQPEFPEAAKARGQQGKVVIQVYTDSQGNVRRWKIVREEPAGLGFGFEVLKIIPKWKFTPAIQQGKPVGVWIAIPFNFRYR